ncbi:hypothetical protein GmHk_14G042116 [Glycine max]|nr:hypothetical protein GmHk_14G042116 [Glycine max]
MEAINLKGLKIVDDEEELFIHTEVTNEEQPNLSLCLGPLRGVTIQEIEIEYSSSSFFIIVSFDKHLLILSLIKEVEIPKEIPLFKVPSGFNTMGVEQSIANYVKEFLDYEEKNNSGLSHSQSLMRTKKIRKQGGEAKEVLFKYEKLGVFCYYSGLLGHILKTTVKGFFLQALMMALVCGEKGLGLN